MKNKPNGDLVNEKVPFSELLVIDQNGTKLGVMSKKDALSLAKEQGLDLLVVSPNSNPPVSKILDYGRHKYQLQKQDRENKKRQNIIHNREIRITTNIGEHDLEFKAKKAIEFLKDGDRVKISLKFRGREISRKEYGRETLMKFYEMVQDYGILEEEPKLLGQFYNIYIIAKRNK